MKNPIKGLRKEFESRVKLGIMSVLVVNESMDFNDMKEILEVTDGNLASHLRSLEKLEFVVMEKSFAGRKPRTSYAVTKSGKKAFEDHLNALEEIINRKNE